MNTLAVFLAAAVSLPQEPGSAVPNWSAPPLWRPPTVEASSDGDAREAEGGAAPDAIPTDPLVLVGIAPCRLVDTRGVPGGPTGAYGPPELVANTPRSFDVDAGSCPGIPATAGAFSLNFTVIASPGAYQNAFLTVFPTGGAQPTVSTLNFDGGELVANAAVVPAGTGGSFDVFVAAAAHLIVDVNGYYVPLSSQTGSVVTSLAGGTGALTLTGTNGITASRVGQAITVTSNATSSNTTSAIVSRDASGGFAAGTIDLTGSPHLLTTAAERLLHRTGSPTNLFLGASAGGSATTGASNTAVGALALFSLGTGEGNTAVGHVALSNDTTGIHNSAFGSFALAMVTTGCCNAAFGSGALSQNVASFNSAFGYFALSSNAGGTGNAAFGYSTLFNNSTGNRNAAFGALALEANATGDDSSAFGTHALKGATGSNNSAFGSLALTSTTTGEDGAAFGAFALQANTTGQRNSAFGKDALSASTTASDNAAFGWSALKSCTAGNNAAFGSEALAASSTGTFNTAFGSNALLLSTTGSDNAGFGTSALNSLGTGSQNVAIGSSAGGVLTTGSNNVYLGYNVDAAGGAESNTIRIGNQAAPPTGGAAHTAVFVGGVSGQTSASGVAVLVNSSGKLGTTTSSRRYKTGIEDVGERSDVLGKLRPVTFLYREDLDPDRVRQYGLIAEEVAEVAPDLVVLGEDGRPETVRYHLLVPLLLDALQKQQREIQELRREVRALASAAGAAD